MKKIISVAMVIVFLGVNSSGVSACTGFSASNENLVLVGNNEDLSLLAEPQLRIIPPSGNGYGRVMFYCKWPFPFDTGSHTAFGGLNDQGLFFDIYSTPHLTPTNPLNKPTYTQDIFAFCIKTCATVDEVVKVFDSYYIPYMDDIQAFFVDRTGDAAIIEGDTVIYKQGSYQVVTNFLQSHPELGEYPCWRYETATSMLKNMTDLSVDYFRDICEAVHMEGIQLPDFMLDTIYSNVCDLNNGVMYLYFFHDYVHCVELRLPDIFELGNQCYNVSSLFADNSSHTPNKPKIMTGQISGRTHREYEYSSVSTDDDGDVLFYLFDWGDGTNTGWIGYHKSGDVCTVSHAWTEEGAFEVRVKSKDVFGYESEWSDPLSVTMPKTYDNPFQPFFERLFEWFLGTIFKINS